MTTSAGQQTLKQSLQQELSAMQELHQKLHDEQSALVDDDAGSLIQLLDQKNEVLRLLTELEKNRFQLINAAGYRKDASGMREFLDQNADSAEHALWQDLLSATELAKEKNRVNGSLIARKLAQNQAALNVFQQGSDTGSLYGPSGQTSIRSSPVKGVIVR